MKDQKHTDRVYVELRAAGMTPHGFTKIETKHLPEIIHEDEHIQGVAYGRGSYLLDSAMLVATDKRAIFLDFKYGYKNWDEVTYGVVAGVKIGISGLFASITLHTRVQDYDIRYVNIGCAKNFVKAIESHIELQKNKKLKEQQHDYMPDKPEMQTVKEPATENLNPEAEERSTKPEITAVLSTVDLEGKPHASVVHYLTDKDDTVYFLTKSGTAKAQNIANNRHVMLTIHSDYSLKVHYIHGQAIKVTDPKIIHQVVSHIFNFREYDEGLKLPPIAQINSGDVAVYKVTSAEHQIRNYSDYSW